MCVNPKKWILFGREVKGPDFGDVCTVIRVVEDGGRMFYGLKEWDSSVADWDASVFFRLEDCSDKMSFS